MSEPVSERGYATNVAPWWAEVADEDTPELVWPQSVLVYDRMRRQDAQVMSVLRAVTLPIRRTSWRVEAGPATPEVAAFIADELGLPLAGQEQVLPRTRDRFSWSEHLRLALLMLPFGHSFFEQVYRPDPVAGRLHLRKLGWRPPRTISKVDVASDGGLEGIRQFARQGGSQAEIKIPVDRLVAYVNDREGGNWLGSSLLRPAYKDWLLKDRALRTQAQTLDRNGLGVPIYTSPPDPEGLQGDELHAWRKKDRETGLNLATQYRGGTNAGAALAHGAELELKGVTGKLPDALPQIRYHDQGIARAALVQFLTLGGDNSTGSYALGDVFADFFVQSLQTVAQDVRDVTNQHVVEDLVDWNFGVGVPAPRLVFDEIGSRHPVTAEAIRALVECGALTLDEPLERHLRRTYNLPAADPTTRRPPSTGVAP